MYCILQGIQLEVGHYLIDHVYCINTSMPEHEAVPLSHKTCLQIEAVFDLAKTEHAYQIVSYLIAAQVVYLVI